ncbi:MAG TPA: hypothetical protein VG275_07025 [Solirubrobacteraceae bacterium]|jgi:hypothetical protein|nr:hypothetical protein [Solirubrobacteraceae bacterium]
MAFPSPSLAPPALSTYQLSYGGLVFGGVAPGSTYQLQGPLSIDMPDVASGDVQRALDQGEFKGLDVLPGADITIVQAVTCGSPIGPAGVTEAQARALDAAVQDLGGVLGPGGVSEIPLWLQMASGTFCRLCRPRKHNCPLDINRVYAGVTIATTLLHSTDPRWYLAPSQQSAAVGLPAAVGGGLAIPAAVPWSLGAGSAGGLITVVNSGKFESRPLLIITGPCTNPVITNTSLPGSPWIGVTQALNAGDTLVIDTDWLSVVYTTAGSSAGSPRRNALMAGTTWWNLPANSSSVIEFSSADTAPVSGTLTVQSASAYLSL